MTIPHAILAQASRLIQLGFSPGDVDLEILAALESGDVDLEILAADDGGAAVQRPRIPSL